MTIADLSDVPIAKYRGGDRVRLDVTLNADGVGPKQEVVCTIVRIELDEFLLAGSWSWFYGVILQNLDEQRMVLVTERDIKGLEGGQP